LRPIRPLLALISLALVAAGAAAQPFPSKPVRILVHFPAAGATDAFARLWTADAHWAAVEQLEQKRRTG